MKPDSLRVILIPAPNDPPLHAPDYQREIRELEDSLRSSGLRFSTRIDRIEAAVGNSPATFLGDFVVITKTLGPYVGAALAGWLKGKDGRKVRLKIGDLEAEAPSVNELERLLKLAGKQGEKASLHES